ncbi:O-antigen ligase family protein [Paenibacillus cisolokensis]|uniref:O-antigen ligase family protein n=1 Tax=Paenibacillus cisolokensis TaxID=1658519 RepID=UPI001BCC7FD6|nr:O-antigen ligase family protein [Paenibacillus cisolokensis]
MPFRQGLFNGWDFPYERPILDAMIVICTIMVLITAFLAFQKWNPGNWASILAILIWLLPAVYSIAAFGAASRHSSQFMILISCTLSAFFVFGLYLLTTDRIRTFMEAVLMISGYVIVVYGLLNYFGQTYYPDALWYTLGTYRLSSVFQYPNTYAAVLTAIFLAALYYVTHATKWYWKFAHALMLVPTFVSLILTLSRAALVILPVIILIVLPFLRLTKQVQYLLHIMIAAIASFAITGGMGNVLNEVAATVLPKEKGGPVNVLPFWNPLSLKGWLLVLSASVVSALIILAIHRWVEPWLETKLSRLSNRKWSAIVVPAGLVILGLFAVSLFLTSPVVRNILPATIADRLENINFNQHSVLERATFYKDGLKLAADYPFFGAGGGAWAALFQQYQNNPYYSSQAHSYIIQTLVETGWLGLLVHLLLIGAAYCLYIRSYVRYPEKRGNHFILYIFATSILIHSFIDFDMSYLSISALVFFCLGGMLSPYGSDLAIGTRAWMEWKGWRLAYPVFLGLITVIVSFSMLKEYYANTQFFRAISMTNEQKPLNELLRPLNRAIELSPANPKFLLVKIDWMEQGYAQTKDVSYMQEAKKIIDRLKQYEPNNRLVILAKYRYHKNMNEIELALDELHEGVKKFPWDIEFYNTAIHEHYLLGERELLKYTNRDNESWNSALKLYNEIERRMQLLEELPEEQLQGRRFDISPDIRQLVAQIYYFTGKPERTIELLKSATGGDLNEPLNRSSVRFYLAALDAIGQRDDELKRKLFAADPEEEQRLQELLKTI